MALWDWLKYEICEFSLRFAKKGAKEKGKEEIELLSDLEKIKMLYESQPTVEISQRLGNVKADQES